MTEGSDMTQLPTNDISDHPDQDSTGQGSHHMIFINQYSTDQTQKKHGPGRRAIGSYVQITIHRRKRLETDEKLKTSLRNSMGPAAWKYIQPHQPLTLSENDVAFGADQGDPTAGTTRKYWVKHRQGSCTLHILLGRHVMAWG